MRQPGISFDLDGTVADSVYQHVTAWHNALLKHDIVGAQWRIHRAIGMSGRLFLPKPLKDAEHSASRALVRRLEKAHDERFNEMIPQITPLSGSLQLFKQLKRRMIPFAVVTSGEAKQTSRLLGRIGGLPPCPVITADDVASAKPAPDLFELAASKLEKEPTAQGVSLAELFCHTSSLYFRGKLAYARLLRGLPRDSRVVSRGEVEEYG